MLNLIAVFIGGGAGAVCRYLITNISNKLFDIALWGTFISNITGCFLIGCIMGYTLKNTQSFPPALKLFLTAGFLGGLTTFSTFSCESLTLLKDGKILQGSAYMMFSLIIGLAAAYAGFLASE